MATSKPTTHKVLAKNSTKATQSHKAKKVKGEFLTFKQEAFVKEYLLCGNASESARKAGYCESKVRNASTAILSLPQVQKAIRKGRELLNKKYEISEEAIITRLAELAFNDERLTSDGNIPIKVTESLKALELIMRNKGMVNDKVKIQATLDISALEKARERAKHESEQSTKANNARKASKA